MYGRRSKGPHSSGGKIGEFENVKELVVRWARTSKPAAAEEELHKLYVKEYGKWPKYTERT